MTLPASGPLSFAQILAEIGDSFPVTIPNANWRTLAGKPTGPLVIPNDFWGKSWRGVELVHTSSSASEVAQYGADTPGRWIAILAISGSTLNPYNLSATISGVAGTVIGTHCSWNGGAFATATAIIVGQPSGTSGTVSTATSGGNPTRRFYVLRVTGYDLSAAIFADDSLGIGIPPWSANVPANGLTLGIIQNENGISPITWTGLTERIADNVLVETKINSAAWDINMAANPAKAIDVTASDTDGFTSACIATFAAS